ncbi:MAG: sensor histidine kinase [Pseudomonadales bacterium]
MSASQTADKLLTSVRQSLFLRLLLIFSMTLILLLIVASLATQMIYKDRMDRFGAESFFARHVNAMIDDIGIPPDLHKAAEIASQLPITVLITGPNFNWKSDARPIDLRRIRVMHHLPGDVSGVRTRAFRGLRILRGEWTYYFFARHQLLNSTGQRILYLAIAAAIATLCLNYWLVRRLLKPVQMLKEGAERISAGELDFRVTHRRNDELGDLTGSINHMADSLQSMLAAKQQLLLAISHELRTPITRAKVQLELLPDDDKKDSLREDINELERLVAELLEAERLHSTHGGLNLESTPLAVFTQELLQKYWPHIQRIHFDITQPDHAVPLDRMRYSLLLRNLVTNALRHGGDGPVQLSIIFNSEEATLTVTDQGNGIAPEHLQHLTEPFYRADSARQRQTGGLGLGLHLCHLIAEAHGGSLDIESELGSGTQIQIKLPR